MTERVSVAIFAKAPVAGYAKTRLIPRLGPEGAAKLQHQMIEQAVTTALDSSIGPVSLWCAPDYGHDVFSSLSDAHGISLHKQTGADLGARMLAAFEALSSTSPLIIIGTDCLVLRPYHLADCANRLWQGNDAVFIPTEDGGYALVGAAKPWPRLFQNMPWGTAAVMAETRLRAAQLDLRTSEAEVLWDVDEPEDHERAVALGLLASSLMPN